MAKNLIINGGLTTEDLVISKDGDTVDVKALLDALSKLLGVDGIEVVSELPSDAANTNTLYLVTSN
jgi:hypothetical protein